MAVLTGVTVLAVSLATYTVFPSGVIAISPFTSALIGRPAWFVAVKIGVTVPVVPLAT